MRHKILLLLVFVLVLAVTPVMAQEGDRAWVRVFHLALDWTEVDTYWGGDLILEATRPVSASDWVAEPAGTITFSASDGRPPLEGTIANGAYSVQVSPGERRVEIRHYVELKDKKGPGGETLTLDTIPVRYNNESTLKAQVTAEGPNEFSFKIESK